MSICVHISNLKRLKAPFHNLLLLNSKNIFLMTNVPGSIVVRSYDISLLDQWFKYLCRKRLNLIFPFGKIIENGYVLAKFPFCLS